MDGTGKPRRCGDLFTKRLYRICFNYLPTDTLATFVFTSQNDAIETLLQSMDKEEFNRLQEVLSYEQEQRAPL